MDIFQLPPAPDPGILLNYKKGEELWDFPAMEMRLARPAAAWDAGLRLLDNG